MRERERERVRRASALMAAVLGLSTAGIAGQTAPPRTGMTQPTILYGAAYYNEYNPAALEPEQLEKDVAMMKTAGITVVRMGESTWSLWEPADGEFDPAWMDRTVGALSKAGIKVIMGTPTYSMPTWMVREHPEFYVRPAGGAQVSYGMRQNMDYDNPKFRFYAERVITRIVQHYRDDPAVIGWQIDNETGSYGATNPDVFTGFVEHLQQKFGTTDAMNKAWFLNYWGQDVNTWAEMPTRDDAISTGYKLEWTRWQQMRVARYLAWQSGLVRRERRPDQFITQNFGGVMKGDVDEQTVAPSLDVIGNDPYHGWQDHMDGSWQALSGDYSRALKHGNFLVLETNAQTLGWNSAGQYPPYNGQLRLDVYTHVSSGANMVEYWHWHSLHSGQETYWKGVIGHDLQPNRAYAEVTRVAHELQRVGPELANMQIHNEVAILYSVDSANAIGFMPFKSGPEGGWVPGKAEGEYGEVLAQLHQAAYDANVGTDIIFPDVSAAELARYKLVMIPALYISDDGLLQRISDYVEHGGHVLMTFKSGFANENSAVRWEMQPGPLRKAAGFRYQEFSNLEKPVGLKGDPFGVGQEKNWTTTWAEFLEVETAKPLAYYDHPFFGRWPAITQNHFGSGSLTYEGTAVSDAIQKRIVLEELRTAGLAGPDQELPASVRVKHGVSSDGHRLHYYLNYSSQPASIAYAYADGGELLGGAKLARGQKAGIGAWDVLIVREDGAVKP